MDVQSQSFDTLKCASSDQTFNIHESGSEERETVNEDQFGTGHEISTVHNSSKIDSKAEKTEIVTPLDKNLSMIDTTTVENPADEMLKSNRKSLHVTFARKFFSQTHVNPRQNEVSNSIEISQSQNLIPCDESQEMDVHIIELNTWKCASCDQTFNNHLELKTHAKIHVSDQHKGAKSNAGDSYQRYQPKLPKKTEINC